LKLETGNWKLRLAGWARSGDDMIRLTAVVEFLDKVLETKGLQDSSNNGLQVENRGRVRRVACGVSATLQFFEAARERGADLLICHHGLSWGDSLKRITGLHYRRLAFLIRNDMALYASHLPLDAHPRHGNNALLCRALGLRQLKAFGVYGGREIGFAGRLPRPLSVTEFTRLVARATGSQPTAMEFGPRRIRTVGVVSGGGAGEIEEAGRKGLDAFLTGEPVLHAYDLARELGVHAVFAGHYATEVFGVRALGELVRRRFGLPAELIDLGIPY
jgi:dinuclear metal center YbgI/SA1388 family protein